MSYLRGPLTRVQIRQWMQERQRVPAREVATFSEAIASPEITASPGVIATIKHGAAESAVAEYAAAEHTVVEPAVVGATSSQSAPPSPWEEFASVLPVLPSDINQYFLPVRISLEWAIRSAESDRRMIIYQDKQLIYRPAFLAQATVHIDNDTHNVHEQVTVSRVMPLSEDESFIDWKVKPLAVKIDELDEHPAQGARFAPLPALLVDVRRLNRMEKGFADHVYRETSITLAHHPVLKLTARPDESESQFKRRCYRAIEEKRDAEIRKLEKGYQSKIDRLDARIRREERELEQDEAELRARKREELISAGESVFNLFAGRRQSRMLSTASRKRRLTQQSKAEVQESLDALEDLEGQIQILLDDLEQERSEIQARWSEAADALETVQVRPRKSDVFVEAWGVVWVPYWDVLFEEEGRMRQLSLAAFESAVPV